MYSLPFAPCLLPSHPPPLPSSISPLIVTDVLNAEETEAPQLGPLYLVFKNFSATVLLKQGDASLSNMLFPNSFT